MIKPQSIIILFLFLFPPFHIISFSQSKISFPLHNLIRKTEKQNEQIHIAVVGDIQKIKSAVKKYGGIYKYNFTPPQEHLDKGIQNQSINSNHPVSFVSIPAKNIISFSKNEFVEKIEFSGGKPVIMNDTLRINMNVNKVHNGAYPLLQAYDGTGVIVGIIDAGIELDHPDFRDSLGKTRVISVWDQNIDTSNIFYDPLHTPQPYGYGQVWDSTAINGGFHHHSEPGNFYGHGSHVSGIAAGNGKADSLPVFKGMAPNANIIVVASNFNSDSWLQTVADAVDYIFNAADAMGKPCVINISAGTYAGSHDGKDFVARYINNLVESKSGRAVVCAAGNAGQAKLFHLRTAINADTKFTWFKKYNSLIIPGYAPNGAIYFELYSDTANFNNINFSFGADMVTPFYQNRGMSSSYSVKNLFNGLYSLDSLGIFGDTLKNSLGQKLANIYFGADIINNGTTYILYVLLSPDSNQYNYRFSTSGTGLFDVWSSESTIYTSDMLYDSLPSFSEFPEIANYSIPDNKQSIVSSFSCAPSVITVGNYTNRYSYFSYFGVEVITGTPAGSLSPSSSKGPTRDGRTKPDIAAPGSPVLSAGTLSNLAGLKNSGNNQLAIGGMHREFSGTSMASPAVAGLAALYFQKCPGAGILDFYNALINNARTDTATGVVPNNKWGYGKADAFQTLISSNFSVSLTNPDSVACPGAVKLTVDSTYPFYQWNTGSTGISNTVGFSGNYFATVTNGKGCKSRTDTVQVYINDSLPSPSISVTGPTYFCSGDSVKLSYPDTFLIYLWNNGKTSSSIFAGATNYFKVTATATNGCKFPSDSVLVWAKPNPPVPFISQIGDTLISTPANTYQWYLNNASLPGDTNQEITISTAGYYKVEVFHINGCSTLSDSIYAVKTGEEYLYPNQKKFRIEPNPNEGVFYLKQNNQTKKTNNVIKGGIFNLLGENIFPLNEIITESGIKINLSENPPGFYLIKITGDIGLQFSGKIIVK